MKTIMRYEEYQFAKYLSVELTNILVTQNLVQTVVY